MFERMKQNNILFAVVFFTFILVFGVIADNNLYRFKYYGETNSNYEFGETEGNIKTEYVVNFPWKVQLVDFNGLVRNMVGQREMNGVIKLNNGYLTEIAPALSDTAVATNAAAIIAYNNYCNEHGIQLVYVNPAYKISKYDDELPIGVTDGHNDTVDNLLSHLQDGGVDVIDLRKCMFDDAINQYALYYKTDHHWTTEGAFYGYQKIAIWISDKTNTYLDKSLLDINNYNIDTYPQWHLGTRGQRTGALFAGIDDYDLIYPKFETRIHNIEDGNISSLKNALVRMDVFQNRNVQSRYTYDSAYKLNDINSLESLDAKTNLKVLLLSDSFKQAIKPYMLLTYDEFHVSDYGTLSTSVLQKYQPDVVVILPWPGYFQTDDTYFKFVDDAQ